MNQILFTHEEIIDTNSNKNFQKSKKNIYFYTFIILIIIISIIFIIFIYNKYSIYKKNSSSANMINTYNISTLYPSNSNYTALQLSNNISIIGLIEIPKIDISYPILSQSNEELLKISVCKFSRSFT